MSLPTLMDMKRKSTTAQQCIKCIATLRDGNDILYGTLTQPIHQQSHLVLCDFSPNKNIS